MKIIHDQERCQGLGICESISAEHFETNDDGTMTVIKPDFTDDELELVERAVESCPTRSLRIER
ncbi:ferredoxin [Antricoccus suffuscus]|uniref:Ferredoxin n=1 Tax=Antricoccus suffuscus TaxID=1629062 RepID=A0A2T1A2L8_9ACTN|nr:ferredoxin [Antricoccus suffuscus]PRZ42845.1 ferredoxin [Antricoccus suffuscus]